MDSKKKKIIIAVVAAVLVVLGVIIAVIFGNNITKTAVSEYSAEIKEDSIEFYKGDELVQIDKYPDSKLVDLDFEYAKEHIEFKDINFDGKADACLAISKDGNAVKYMCWLFENERFVYNKELSALTSISVDAENKQLIAVDFTKPESEYVTYKWVDGVLSEVSRIKTDSPEVPTEIIEAVENNSVDVRTDDTTKPRSETAEDTEGAVPENEKKPVAEAAKNNKAENNKTKDNKTKDNKVKDNKAGNNKEKTEATTKKAGKKDDKPTAEKATEAVTGDVVLATGDIDDGWF